MSLDLSCQNLKNIPYIDPEFNIHTLILSGNQIEFIDNIPNTVVNLDLSENLITQICNIPDSVKKLDLYGNKITQIHNIPDNIIYLDLSNNLITQFNTYNFTNVQVLYIYDNLITQLPNQIYKFNKLKQINYYGNPITTINKKLFNKFNKLERHNLVIKN